jgi:hypothetical protein
MLRLFDCLLTASSAKTLSRTPVRDSMFFLNLNIGGKKSNLQEIKKIEVITFYHYYQHMGQIPPRCLAQ